MRLLPLLLAGIVATSLAAAERPNVLWIIGEDVGADFACYGRDHVVTPNVDQLAREGVRYTNAFTVTPVCSTSRSAFMTGHYSWAIGAHNHRSHRGDGYQLPAGVRVLTDRLRDVGYYTANIRKFPAGAPSDLKGSGKTDWNFKYGGGRYAKPFDSDKWADLKSHQPFYAQVNFSLTHRGGAWDAAQKTADPKADPAQVSFPSYYPDHPVVRESWAAYHNALNVLDRHVGEVLEFLEKDGLADNTIVVFMGDHGRAMPRGKQWPYDSGLRIPFVVRMPKSVTSNAAAGSVSDDIVESIDLTAQTLSWSGAPVPAAMHGRPFLDPRSEKRDFAFGGRDRGDETVFRARTIRSKQYRYIRNYFPERPYYQVNRYKLLQYPIVRLMRELKANGELTGPPAELMADTRSREELYDCSADPDEVNNLANDPNYRELLLEMRAQLEDAVARYGDEGRFPEDPEVIEANNLSAAQRSGTKLQAKYGWSR